MSSRLPSRPFARPAADPRRRARAGHRRSVGAGQRWELASAHGDPARCAAFLDRLETMSAREWAVLGSPIEWPSPGSADAALAAVLEAQRLGVTAWLVRDAVETATIARPVAVREAAARAALAHLAHDWLRHADYRALLAPFVALAWSDA
jgi:hypothetical protein